jgi:Flp pilus assembly protein TadD
MNRSRRSVVRRRPRLVVLVPAALLALVSLGLAADWWFGLPEGQVATYVGRQSCIECHQQESAEWAGSDHDLAMDLATKEFVLGDFDDAEFTYQGVTSRMFRKDGKYFIHTEGPTGELEDFEIKYTFGVRPLQQYMVEFDDGRVQVLRVSWDTEKRRWFYVPPPDVINEKIEPGDPLHWTGTAQNWNHTCADCHSTNVHKNFDLKSNTYHTTFSEIDVSCEACHGPGSLHVELANSKSPFWDRNYGYGLAQLKGKDTRPQIETCAKCHSRRNMVHADFTPGSQLLDFYEPELLHEGIYHADGQILDEVYVHGSFQQSKMFHKGVRCTDCHNPHSLKMKFEGNKLCTQCHEPGKYDGPAHHHHPVESKGASCVECHMPTQTYMVVDPRRDHSLRVPRPDLTLSMGVPNACNTCHTKPDENAKWAADQVVEWYGEKRPDDPHYGPALAAGRAGTPYGEEVLRKLLRPQAVPDIVKATAVALLGQYETEEARLAVAKMLRHANPLVRVAAVRVASGQSLPEILASLGELPQEQNTRQAVLQSLQEKPTRQLVELLAPLLSDPVRAVRIAAARRLAGLPPRLFAADQYDALTAAIGEYREAQLLANDRAGSHLNLGNLYQQMGDLKRAVRAFKTAIHLEPYLTGARSNLASLYEQAGEDAELIKQLRAEELALLARDARLLPNNAGVRHRYGLTLYLLDQLEQAETELTRACELAPDNTDFRMVLTLLYEKIERWDDALRSAELLKRLAPEDPGADQVFKRIQAAASQR